MNEFSWIERIRVDNYGTCGFCTSVNKIFTVVVVWAVVSSAMARFYRAAWNATRSYDEISVGVGRPLLPEILGSSDRVGSKSPIFDRSASAVTHSEESSIITNRKSTTRFPMSQR